VLATAGFGAERIRWAAHRLTQAGCSSVAARAASAADPPRPWAGRAFPVSPNLRRSLSPHRNRRGSSNCRASLRRRACGARSLTSSLSLDRCGQGRADAPRLRGSAAHRPERLESYRSPLIISVGRCTSLWVATRAEALTHPFARLSPRGLVKDPSVPTELGQFPALHLAASSLFRPKMLPVNSCIPRCQRRAPELRVAIDSLEARR
jgi:hypothetical protein